LISLFGFLGIALFVVLAEGLKLPELSVPFPIIAVYILIVVGAWFRLNFFLCPRCKKPFAIAWWFNLSVFARKCVHCGLEKFTDGDDQSAA
jgi:hypothetical protein